MKDRIKRIFAFLIDWNIACLPTVILAPFILRSSQGRMEPLAVIALILLMFATLAAIVLRDVLGNGRSLGKRIMKLKILDKTTLRPPRKVQVFLRNVFLPFCTIDGIILLTTGSSLGDLVTGTVVLSDPSTADQPIKPSKKEVICLIAVVISITAITLMGIFFLVDAMLDSQKGTPQYQLAYDYLTSSETFAQLDAQPSQIHLNRYSSNTSPHPDDGTPTSTVTFGFVVAGRSLDVVCHEQDGQWQVCQDCTVFH